jgi:hypothetical protein
VQQDGSSGGLGNPLITVTINPLEQNEVTYIADSPESRRISIGSASSLGRGAPHTNMLVPDS